MKKIKLFMLSAMALLLSFACISCDNGITTKLNKLKTTYDSIYIPYNSYGPNYQITLPLDKLVPEMNQFYYGQVIDVSFDYYAINEYPDFRVQLVSTDGTADNWWRELAETKKISKEDKLFSGDFGSFKSSFVINNPSSNTDFSKYSLVLKFGLRDGESVDYHVDAIEFLIKDLKVRTNNEMVSFETVSFADGRIVAIPTTEGILFKLKWTNDSFWSDHQWDCIYITNGLSIAIDGNSSRPTMGDEYKELLYPFTSKNGGTYKISYLDETKKMYVPSGIGEINIEPINNIELAFDCTEWPVAKINNLNNSTIPIILGDAYESVTDDIESGNLSPYCYVTLWGGEYWDTWLGKKDEYNLDVFNNPYDLLFACSYDPTGIINSIINKGGYWYDSGLCFKFVDKKYGDCVYRNVYSSERIYCVNSSMQDFINAYMTYYSTH